MATRRNSRTLVNYLGAEVKAAISKSKLSNLVSDGQGGERVAEAAIQRMFVEGQTPSSLNIDQYEFALGYFQQMKVVPLAARAMALVLVDAAKAQGTTVMKLIENVSADEMSVLQAETYNYLNQLRSGTSQLAGSKPVDNTKSYRARYLKA